MEEADLYYLGKYISKDGTIDKNKQVQHLQHLKVLDKARRSTVYKTIKNKIY